VAQAQCLHCHKLFKVNRDVGTSAFVLWLLYNAEYITQCINDQR